VCEWIISLHLLQVSPEISKLLDSRNMMLQSYDTMLKSVGWTSVHIE
jgi:hypothetical protein